MLKIKKTFIVLVACLFLGASCPSFALVINVIDLTGGTQPTAVAAFMQAAGLWAGVLFDPITVNINFNFVSLPPNVLGGTSSFTIGETFTDVKTALAGDATSADDTTAVANLPPGASMVFRTNDTTSMIILDSDLTANNTDLDVNRANAKALGLLPANDAGIDASIEFSTDFPFDFNPADGITAGQHDFVGVSAHEIGHALGFRSGVDVVDITSGASTHPLNPTVLDPFRVFSPWDLFRYSVDSLTLGGAGTFDFATGPHPGGLPYFSINGGTTSIATYETGSFNGTGRQASHWRDNLSLGIMDPTFASGELGVITALDIQAFDVMGYDLTPIPEPSTFVLFGISIVGVFGYGWRRRKRLTK